MNPLLLAGDIGGTNTRLRLAEIQAEELSALDESDYANSRFPDLVSIVQQFLTAATEKLGYPPAPQKACFAVAGPVRQNTCQLTNLGWELKGEELGQKLNIPKVTLINDFEALGYGLLQLGKADLETLQEGERREGAPIAVIGAGTGLGEAFIIKHGNEGQVYATEGGHADFAARTEDEFELLKYLKDRYRLERISVERVVSGLGIIAIYQFLRDRKPLKESPEIAKKVRDWEEGSGSGGDPPAAIAGAALDRSDPLSEKAMQMFVEAYGTEAGNFALKLLPYGGLYIAGGIASKILPLIQEGNFLRALTNKGRMKEVIEKIPVHVVRHRHVGLIGAAYYAASHINS